MNIRKVILLGLLFSLFSCTSEKDHLNHEIVGLKKTLESKVQDFHGSAIAVKQSPFSFNLDSLIGTKPQLDSLYKSLDEKINTASSVLKKDDLNSHRASLESLSIKINQSTDYLLHAKTIRLLKSTIVVLEQDIHAYDSLAKHVSVQHFLTDLDQLMILEKSIIIAKNQWEQQFDSSNAFMPVKLRMNLLDKWNLAVANFDKTQNQLLIDFSRSVLFLMVKGDQRVSRLIDWHHLVVDADNHGRYYRNANYVTRQAFAKEVIKTTSGMFSFLYNASKYTVTNVHSWKVNHKTKNTAIITARSNANETLRFNIIKLNNQMLLSHLKTS